MSGAHVKALERFEQIMLLLCYVYVLKVHHRVCVAMDWKLDGLEAPCICIAVGFGA